MFKSDALVLAKQQFLKNTLAPQAFTYAKTISELTFWKHSKPFESEQHFWKNKGRNNWVIRLLQCFWRSQNDENAKWKGCLSCFGHFQKALQNTYENEKTRNAICIWFLQYKIAKVAAAKVSYSTVSCFLKVHVWGQGAKKGATPTREHRFCKNICKTHTKVRDNLGPGLAPQAFT